MAAILIVDDDASTRNRVSDLVRREDFTVGTARNGQEALQMLQRTGGWDVVVTDLHMPVMDGLELAKEVASRYEGLPVILVSGDPGACAAPVFAALAKPVVPHDLLDALDAALLYRLSGPS